MRLCSLVAQDVLPIGLLEPFALLAAIYRIVFLSFSAKPLTDPELVGLSLSLITLAGLSDRLSKIPLGRA